MKKLSNISTKELRSVLSFLGLRRVRIKGGHEAWTKEGLLRAVIFQTHIEPVPEFIVKNVIADLGISRTEFIDLLEKI